MGTVVDDRGVRQRFRRRVWLRKPQSVRAKFDVARKRFTREMVAWGLTVGGALFCASVVDHLFVTTQAPKHVFWLAGSALIGLAFLVAIPLWLGFIGMRVIRLAYLLAPVCYVCNYDLANLNACDDGCTVCPECGAAWKLGAATARSSSESKSSE